MKRVFAVLSVLGALLVSCSQDEDALATQQSRIESYLRSTHSPRLISASERAEGEEVPFYSVSGSRVYRYIANYFAPGRDERPEVTPSSTVAITFRAYVFEYKNIATGGTTVTMPYYTNDPLLYDAFLSLEGFNPELWDFEPLRLEMSGDDILKGLRHALLGCRAGDEIEAYMTYNMAYGKENFSLVPRESPIAIFFTVNSVE